MLRILLGFGTVLGLIAGTASAADLPRRAPPAPPVVVAPDFTWTGFYAGVQAGYAFSQRQTIRTTEANGSGTGLFIDAIGAGAVSSRQQGFVAGGQAGYNVQFTPGSGIVLGIETDLAYTDLDRTRRRSGPLFGGFGGSLVTSTTRQSLDLLGTVRGRLGYAFDRVLVYGTGGFAYGHVRTESAATFEIPGVPSLGLYAGKRDRLETGFAYGGGIEYALPTDSALNVFRSPTVTLKAEYLRYDLGKRNLPLVNSVGGVAPTVDAVSRFRQEGNIVRVGLNYKFGTY
ncbi:outer membrane beta-barrel protein [uncultured Methylobacterium sp.]|jgi:outer membrane immunogenic protein|uniref:outer membrane protein n=1 Tax=uncultured Methylobacterium sp. TaxID=157278 RepID=UPI002603EE06|nr:outer membrane beta-barrel protein [uncultured Methylobacterium sp.]